MDILDRFAPTHSSHRYEQRAYYDSHELLMRSPSLISDAEFQSNGTFTESIIIGPSDDYLIEFAYKYIRIADIDVRSVFDTYEKYEGKTNIIIDYRMNISIAYLCQKYDNLLIFDIDNGKVITLTQYVSKRLFSGRLLTYNTYLLKQVLFLYVFVVFYCKHLSLQWISVKAYDAVVDCKMLHGVYDLNILVKYIGSCVSRYSAAEVVNSHVLNCFSVTNQAKPLLSAKSTEELLSELIVLTKMNGVVVFKF